MNAKHESRCHLCNQPIRVGDAITHSNGSKRHSLYVHAGCRSVAGIQNRAAWGVRVLKSDPRGDIPVGHGRQFVHRSKADSVADWLRGFGATVEVVSLAE